MEQRTTNHLRRRPRAFTLIELLVVIGIIAVLMSIMLPTLAGARRTARATIGVANLRSLSQVQFIYSNDFDGLFVYPFRSDWASSTGRVFTDVVDPAESQLVWSFYVPTDPTLNTEGFAFYWYSYLQRYYNAPRLSKELLSPADRAASSLAAAYGSRSETLQGYVLWPSSFLYSPTMWSSGGRYLGPTRAAQTAATLVPQGVNTVVNPAGKVFLWERADFRQPRRSTNPAYPPAYNNPNARVNAATVDGSVTEVSARDLLFQAENNPEMTPCGFASVPDAPPLHVPYVLPQGVNESPASWPVSVEAAGGDDLFPLFFWATYRGAQGRDLAR